MTFQCKILWIAYIAAVPTMAFMSDHPTTRSLSWRHHPSSGQRSIQTHQMAAVVKSSSNSKTKIVPEPLSPSSNHIDYESVNKLTFRELQRACRDIGLGSTGSTATLRNRLLDFHGNSILPNILETLDTPEEV